MVPCRITLLVIDEQTQLLPDILFLCTGLRPLILVDYGGTMPQLQENLCSLLHHARQVISQLLCIKDLNSLY